MMDLLVTRVNQVCQEGMEQIVSLDDLVTMGPMGKMDNLAKRASEEKEE